MIDGQKRDKRQHTLLQLSKEDENFKKTLSHPSVSVSLIAPQLALSSTSYPFHSN